MMQRRIPTEYDIDQVADFIYFEASFVTRDKTSPTNLRLVAERAQRKYGFAIRDTEPGIDRLLEKHPNELTWLGYDPLKIARERAEESERIRKELEECASGRG